MTYNFLAEEGIWSGMDVRFREEQETVGKEGASVGEGSGAVQSHC